MTEKKRGRTISGGIAPPVESRPGLVFKAHRLLHHSTLGVKAMKEKRRAARLGKPFNQGSRVEPFQTSDVPSLVASRRLSRRGLERAAAQGWARQLMYVLGFHLTECINKMVLKIKHPHKIVKLLFTSTFSSVKLTVSRRGLGRASAQGWAHPLMYGSGLRVEG